MGLVLCLTQLTTQTISSSPEGFIQRLFQHHSNNAGIKRGLPLSNPGSLLRKGHNYFLRWHQMLALNVNLLQNCPK